MTDELAGKVLTNPDQIPEGRVIVGYAGDDPSRIIIATREYYFSMNAEQAMTLRDGLTELLSRVAN